MSRDRSLLRLALAAVGFTAIIAQLTLMREMVAAFYGNELLFGTVLAAWLAWGAIGASGLGRLVLSRHERSLPRIFAAGLALLGLLLPATLIAARGSRIFLGVTPGALVDFGPALATVVVVAAPFCLVSGALFTLGVRLAAETNASAGHAYVWESAGAVIGGVLFSFALIRWLDPFQVALLVVLVDWAVAIGVRFFLRLTPKRNTSAVTARSAACDEAIPIAGQEIASSDYRLPRNDTSQSIGSTKERIPEARHSFLRRPTAPLLFCTLALLTLLALLLGRALNGTTLRWQWPSLVYAADSPYGRVTVEAIDSQRVFYTDGLLAFESQGTAPEEVAHFPLLTHPDPRSVLLVGGGVAGDLREILKHPVDTVTYVELDPLLIEAAQAYLPEADAAVLRDPRVQVITTDGRQYVNTTAERFDVVILDLPEPITGALNRFYTSEFFGEVGRILRPGGILALGLPSAENYWSPELARRNASIYRTLETVFPKILVLPGERNFLLASDVALEADPRTLAQRLVQRGIGTRWVTPEYLTYILTTDRFEQVKQTLETAGDVRRNHDLSPISYYYGQVLWASMLNPGLRAVLERASVVSLWWLAAPFILCAALTRWRRAWAVPFTVACAGFAGMLFEIVILFAFQVLHGTLYAEVGLIVAAYMGGLALGAGAANGLLPIANGRWQMANGQWPRRVADGKRQNETASTEHVEQRWGGRPGAVEGHRAMPPARVHPSTPGREDMRPSAQDARTSRSMMLVVLGLMAAFAGVISLVLTQVKSLPAPAFWLMALTAGCLGGMVYPLAVGLWQAGGKARQETGETTGHSAAAGMLYGADLLGGCLGALIGATFLMPVLGIPQTCVMIALAGLAAMVALA
jgi:spermidine synthase